MLTPTVNEGVHVTVRDQTLRGKLLSISDRYEVIAELADRGYYLYVLV